MALKQSITLSKVNRHFKLNFRKFSLVEAALTHPSYRNENRVKGLENFDRLEFFGDSILNYVVCRKLYQLFPEADEGLLSRLRSILVSRKVLIRIAKTIQLRKMLRLGRCLLRDQVNLKTKIYADTLEALFAAYYFDRGLKSTETFILSLYKGYFDAKKLLRIDPNPKSTLQELAQKHWQILPVYQSTVTASGVHTTLTLKKPAHKVTAEAKTKRDSEEKAARLLIRKLRQDLALCSKKASSGRKLRRASPAPFLRSRSLN